MTTHHLPDDERFWLKVDRSGGVDACWLWTATASQFGCGHVSWRGRLEYAPRVSWELEQGPIPDGLLVLHNCPDGDNPACVNPAHLWLGTHQDNARDRNAKGRASSRVGTDNGRSRLTERGVVVVREMVSKGMTQKAVAEFFGLHETTVRYAVIGKHWGHL
jgi:DNA-binding CsgD family transcriptional regulator